MMTVMTMIIMMKLGVEVEAVVVPSPDAGWAP
jgi:hypothetical protein